MKKCRLLKERGHAAFNQQLANAGGVYTKEQVASLLCIAAGEVSTLLKHKQLLAVLIEDELWTKIN